MSVSEPAASQVAGAGTAAGAAAAGGAAGTAVGAAGVGAGLAGIAGGAVAAGAIVAGLVAFLAALRARHQEFLRRELGRFSRVPDDIAAAIADEMVLEREFARNSADRMAAGLPGVLALKDPVERTTALRALLDAEQRFAQQREEAMLARAIAAVDRARLRRESPQGVWWHKGYAHDPTPGCVFMAGGARAGSARFWPWAVIDRVHPPRHYGCPDGLRSFGEGVANGWGAGSVPDVRDAIRAAAGVVMEQQDAEALLRECDVRDALQEQGIDTSLIPWAGVSEAFNAGEPRNFKGEWEGVGARVVHAVEQFAQPAVAAIALKRGEQSAVEPKDVPGLVDKLADGTPSSLHLLQVDHLPNLFREHARELSRSEMPQIPKEKLPGFMDFLRSRRIMATVESRKPSELRATQNQINGAAVAALVKGWDPTRGGIIMVSRSGDVLDGHHRWAAAALHEMMDASQRMDTLRFNASTDRILALMREYNVLAGVKARRFGEGRVPGVAV